MKAEISKLHTLQMLKGHYANNTNSEHIKPMTQIKNQFLKKFKLSKLTQDETDDLNSSITRKEIERVVKILLKKNYLGLDGFTGVSYRTVNEEKTPILPKLFLKMGENPSRDVMGRTDAQTKASTQKGKLGSPWWSGGEGLVP